MKKFKKDGFAVIGFEKLFHIGTLQKKDKELYSHEGEGLSVSICPNEWRRITPLGGYLFELTKEENCFLNFHRLTKINKDKIIAWGSENNFIVPADIYYFQYYDDEFEMNIESSFYDYEKAYEEADESYQVSIKKGYKPTSEMMQRVMYPNMGPCMCFDLLTTIYAEDVLQVDGVYWDDKLDIYCYSAPRGVITSVKLNEWKIKKVTN